MQRRVFISYTRSGSAAAAEAARDALAADGIDVFLDTEAIEPGSRFPARLADALEKAHGVLVFAEPEYFARPWCLYEFRVAMAPYRAAAAADDLGYAVVVLPPGADAAALISALPPALARSSLLTWDRTAEIAALVVGRLASVDVTLADRLKDIDDDAVRALRRGGGVPGVAALAGMPVYARDLPRSLKGRFVGRDGTLWQILHALQVLRAEGEQPSCAIHGAGGVGKTQLAAEFVWRYATRHFPGGVVWINADVDTEDLAVQLEGALKALAPERATPASPGAEPRRRVATAPEALEQALSARTSTAPILWVVDNVPEAAGGHGQQSLATWCPCRGHVTVLWTTRRGNPRAADTVVMVDELTIPAAVDLLTQAPVKRAWLPDAEWERIARWVGGLPLALQILKASLGDRLLRPDQVLARIGASEVASTLDAEARALADEVSDEYVRGVAEAFRLSYEGLVERDGLAAIAHRLALLGPARIPEPFLEGLADTRQLGALFKAGWLQEHDEATGPGRAWRMHRVVASFLRTANPRPDADLAAVADWLSSLFRSERPWELVGIAGQHLTVVVRRLQSRLASEPEPAVRAGARRLALDLATVRMGDRAARGVRYIAGQLAESAGVAPEVVTVLRAIHRDGDDARAVSVAGMLHGMSRTLEAARFAVELLHDPRPDVRRQALVQASDFAPHAEVVVLPLLDAIMRETDEGVRDNAALFFPRLLQPRSPALKVGLSHLLFGWLRAKNPGQRRVAAGIIGRVLRDHGPGLEAGGLTAAGLIGGLLALALDDAVDEVATEAAGVLGGLESEPAWERLAARLGEASEEADRVRAIRRLGAYLEALEAPTPPGLEILEEEGQRVFRVTWPQARGDTRARFKPLADVVASADDGPVRDAALTELTTVHAGKPVLVDAVIALVERAEHERVLSIADAVVRLGLDMPSAPWWRGQALDALGNPEEALAAYGLTVGAFPTFAPAREARGVLRAKQADPAGALEDLDEAIRLGSDEPLLRWWRAEMLGRLGRRDEAIADYDRAVVGFPDHAPARFERGVLLYERGDHAAALADFDEVTRLEPGNARGHHRRAGCLFRLQRWADVIAAESRAIDLDAGVAEYWFFRAAARALAGAHADALADAERAAALDPTDARAVNLRDDLRVICDRLKDSNTAWVGEGRRSTSGGWRVVGKGTAGF